MQLRLGLLAVAALVVAGCSGSPPTGTISNANYAQPFSGTVEFQYTHFDNGGNPLGGVDPLADQECIQDQIDDVIPGGIPDGSPLQACTDPQTDVKIALKDLVPDIDFQAYLVGKDNGTQPLALGAVGAGNLNKTFTEDYDGDFGAFQLRFGELVVATAPTANGKQTVVPNPAFASIGVVGTYKGKDLTLTISGLPDGADYHGRLYIPDATSATGLKADQTFSVANGEVTFKLPKDAKYDLGDVKEFHIHVANSMVNLYKGTLTPAK